MLNLTLDPGIPGSPGRPDSPEAPWAPIGPGAPRSPGAPCHWGRKDLVEIANGSVILELECLNSYYELNSVWWIWSLLGLTQKSWSAIIKVGWRWWWTWCYASLIECFSSNYEFNDVQWIGLIGLLWFSFGLLSQNPNLTIKVGWDCSCLLCHTEYLNFDYQMNKVHVSWNYYGLTQYSYGLLSLVD